MTKGAALGPLQLIAIALGAWVIADLSFHFRPTNYFGGSSDEQRYLESALRWITNGPHPGRTHWSLRHPLVLSLVASFRQFDVSMWALQLVPRLYGDLLVSFSTVMMARAAGLRAAGTWLLLALFTPALHQSATNLGPEIVELAFAAISGWLFWEARGGGRGAGLAMAGSGLFIALAIMTRETAACLLPIYAVAWWRGRMGWPLAFAFVAGFLPPLLIDNGWLWLRSGDPLYRLHVDSAHTGIYSAHLTGGVYHGRVFLNPDLASRWTQAGPIKLFWLTDPIMNFFAAPEFALLFFAWALLFFSRHTRPARGSATARLMPWLLAVTIACYLIVTWVLTLRPQPRYYLVALYAASIAVALLLNGPAATRAAQRMRQIALALVLVCGGLTILLSPDRQRDARLILPWLKAHPDARLHIDPANRDRIAFPAILAGVNNRITKAPARIGQVQVRAFTPKTEQPGRWRQVAMLQGPWLFPYINHPRRLVIERRVE
ncbi:glycosyltransferase family 39 protein [Sphingomonas aracearum]|uniref:Glycosyltransferase RgtA/B/C/D-like domain-containing protein n=1 Tax=Sphingomonas aracearum TaxID=2283317 RepID=A0A369VYS8_9SPHN|nr:glycosyltransferase family 39 protein [Sphingomonas aracearum]RDE07303.1 hypothetical protein DVW87_06675 [Sphingomonas aracearum]